MKKHIAVIKDRDNRSWIFEGRCGTRPIWIEEKHSKPHLLTEEQCQIVIDEIIQPEETFEIRKVRE